MLGFIKNAVRNYMWFNVPYDKEVKIRYFLSSLKLGNLRKKINELRSRPEPATKTREPDKKLRVVFLCQVPQIWNSVKSVYLAAKSDNDIETYILALPEKIMHENYDVNHEEYGENEAYKMCCEFDKETINAYDYSSGKWFDLEKFEPDYVFLPRPYDIHLPPCYRSYELRKYTKICFVDYGYSVTTWALKMTYNVDFVTNCSYIFAESESSASILNNMFNFLRISGVNVKFLGFPRFDLFSNITYGGGGQTFTRPSFGFLAGQLIR